MVDVWWIVIAQLVVTLYLAWKVFSLTDALEKTQLVLGHMIMEVEKIPKR
jgi:hypothetical protein